MDKAKSKKICFVVIMIIFFSWSIVIFVSAFFSKITKAKNEIRGVWIATVKNLNWPQTYDPEEQKQEFISYLDLIKSIGMNRVYFQVRSRADAMYDSEDWPWSEVITGEFGKDPGYDPLLFASEECKKRDIVLEAWINPFLVARPKDFDKEYFISKLPKTNKLILHPEWLKQSEGCILLNLSNPDARKIVIDEAVYIVKKYNIPIHMDDYFYPYPLDNKIPTNFDDDEDFKLHSNGKSLEEFRRNNVNMFVKDLHDAIKKENPDITLSVSPFGIWKNKIEEGGAGTKGLESYYTLFCDSVFWVKNNYVDFIIPQIYWHIGFEIANYKELAIWWNNVVKDTNVKLIIGQPGYKLDENSSISSFRNTNEILNQIYLNRSLQRVCGQSLFSIECLKKNTLNICKDLKELYDKSIS